MTNQTPHSRLVIIRGIPGGGKSYLASALSRAIGGDVTVLDPDATDRQSKAYADHVAALRADGVDEKLYPYRFLRGQAFDAIAAGKTIIWNQAFNDFESFQKMIDRLRAYAADIGAQLAVLVVEVEVDAATARERIAARASAGGHDVDEQTLAGFIAKYESFSNRGYPVVAVSGLDDVSVSVQAVTQALARL